MVVHSFGARLMTSSVAVTRDFVSAVALTASAASSLPSLFACLHLWIHSLPLFSTLVRRARLDVTASRFVTLGPSAFTK